MNGKGIYFVTFTRPTPIFFAPGRTRASVNIMCLAQAYMFEGREGREGGGGGKQVISYFNVQIIADNDKVTIHCYKYFMSSCLEFGSHLTAC